MVAAASSALRSRVPGGVGRFRSHGSSSDPDNSDRDVPITSTRTHPSRSSATNKRAPASIEIDGDFYEDSENLRSFPGMTEMSSVVRSSSPTKKSRPSRPRAVGRPVISIVTPGETPPPVDEDDDVDEKRSAKKEGRARRSLADGLRRATRTWAVPSGVEEEDDLTAPVSIAPSSDGDDDT